MSQGTFHYEQRRLENDRLALEPFDPNVHTKTFVDAIISSPEMFTYTPFQVINSEEDFIQKVYEPVSASPADCLWAVIDKTAAPGTPNHAGVVSLFATDPTNASTEVGVLIFPAFQRRRLATGAVGLVLLWLLDPPSAGGLGLRRVVWQTHSENEVSRKAALRLGFEFEGVLRWHRVFPRGRVALSVAELEKRNGTTGEEPGRHTAVYSIVWDEWDEKRPNVVALIERT